MNESELKKLTKKQLEDYGRTIGVELDRRKTKAKLVQELLDYQQVKIEVQESKNAVDPAPAENTETTVNVMGDEDATDVAENFQAFLATQKAEDITNPTMWVLSEVAKYLPQHKIKVERSKTAKELIVHVEGDQVNGRFYVK